MTTIPPGGWIFEQTVDGKPTKKFKSMGLVWELARNIADFRAGNGLPRATPKEALHDIEEATCVRLHNDPAWCIKKKTSTVRPALDHRSKNANLVDGAKTLVEWLGSGAESVDIPIAQARANVCLKCDRNKDGHSLLKLTGSLVRTIAEQMQVKSEKRLRVEGEEKLHVCSVCDCVISLKIWLKPDILAERTSQAVLNDLPEWCWLKNELRTPLQ